MTDTRSPVVVRIATTPAEARVLTALLQAEGIPAYIEGESLADQVAVSRRLLNLNSVRVLVPAELHARAVELLANTKVEDAELEEQALAAEDPEIAPAPTGAAGGESGSGSVPSPANTAEPFAIVGDRKLLWFEVGLVLFVAWLPGVFTGFLDYLGGPAASGGWFGDHYSPAGLFYGGIHRAGCILLLLYLARRGGQSWSSLGLTRLRWVRDALSGILLTLLQVGLLYLTVWLAYETGFLHLLDGIAPSPRPPAPRPEGMARLLYLPFLFLSRLTLTGTGSSR